jgi:hypothetical protein
MERSGGSWTKWDVRGERLEGCGHAFYLPEGSSVVLMVSRLDTTLHRLFYIVEEGVFEGDFVVVAGKLR